MTRISVVCVLATTGALLMPGYATAQAGRPAPLFETSDRCIACHSALTAASGADISIGFDWRASMMANSARDPYWHAAVRRETIDFPGAAGAIQDECSKCHMPMMRYEAHQAGGRGEVFAHIGSDSEAGILAADGVSCTVCHQIREDGLGDESSFVGGFVVDETPSDDREIFGPYETDEGRSAVMHSATGFRPGEGPHIQSSEMCATCHTLYTHALAEGSGGAELPEQVPYLEWRHSDFRETDSCQSCHMPVVADSAAISSVLGQPRAGVSRHVFRGGNFFMLRMLNKHRDELGVVALPQEMEAAAARTIDHLRTRTARVAIGGAGVSDGELSFDVRVTNLVGHKLPTAYPSRRVWLQVTVRGGDGSVVFESGGFRTDGRIDGNDNDAAGGSFEPHHEVISDEGDVQIYEAILAGPDGTVTTGLLTGVRYLKDNRLLPRGFDASGAPDDIAPKGAATSDADFTDGSDRVRFEVDVDESDGPYRVQVALWYQPIGYRWAANLRDYDADETRRFVRYYEGMAAESATIVATAGLQIGEDR